ncbi:LysR family transcriptional regulator [Solirhodobacter olei]|uniref:LysR family transcriptional regulator n=1 Tax=Solirhodobacter olei TaxID=2493082 RepID=UPI000FD9229D|nr:LysR family transcriptional regulator [Solirhodobacter olei]
MKPPAPLNHIRSFEAAARHLSFTAAAEELGYTQAAISSHVRALEHYIGRQLFHRNPRSLKLTEMGEAFLPTLRPALDQIDHATEAIVASARNRTVVVSCPMSLAENWLAGCLAEYRRAHPEIEVVLHGTIWEDLGEQAADITLSIRREDDRLHGGIRLWDDQLTLLCAPRLLEGPQAIRETVDVLRHDWIFVLGRQEYWHSMAAALGIDSGGHDKALSTNASNIALELAATGCGLIATQRSLALTYLERGLLAEPFPGIRPPSPWTYYLFGSQLSKGSVVRNVRHWILECARSAFATPPSAV